jgi:hypothetical protein
VALESAFVSVSSVSLISDHKFLVTNFKAALGGLALVDRLSLVELLRPDFAGA